MLYHYTDIPSDSHYLLSAGQIVDDLEHIRDNLDNPAQAAWADTAIAAVNAGAMRAAAEYLACMGIDLCTAEEAIAA